MVHLVENNPDSQQHLDENRDKYESDGDYLYRLMKMGRRFSDQEVVSKYGINGRRLRELFHEKTDVKKVWKLNEKGKRLFVEYFVETPVTPTKAKAIEEGQRILDAMRDKSKQGELF